MNDDQLLRSYIRQACREGAKEASFDSLGPTARVDPGRDLMVGSHAGLIKVASGWAKAELVLTTNAAEFVRSRRGGAGDVSPPPVRGTPEP